MKRQCHQCREDRGGGTIFLAAVPTSGTVAGLRRRACRRRAGPPGGTWEGDTVSGGLKPLLLSMQQSSASGRDHGERDGAPAEGWAEPACVGKGRRFSPLPPYPRPPYMVAAPEVKPPSDFRLGLPHSLHFPEEKGRHRSWSASTGSLSPAGLN